MRRQGPASTPEGKIRPETPSDNAHVQPCIGGSETRPDIQALGVERAVQKDGGKVRKASRAQKPRLEAEQQDKEQGEA